MEDDIRQMIHDIRNPLNTISMNAELGKLIVEQSIDKEKLIQLFTIIVKECRACSDRLTDLKSAVLEQDGQQGPESD